MSAHEAAPHEEKPLGRMVPPIPHGVEIPPESPDVGGRALYVASRLLAGATTFFFLAYLFAYFYLRSINADHMWRPAHVKPNQILGAAFIICIIASAALTALGGHRMKRRARNWTALAIGGVVLGLVAVVLQCVEYTVQHFGPTD